MAEVTVAQFAEVLKVPVEKLLTQLDEAGIKVSGSDAKISDEAKLELLTYLRRSHGQDDTPATAAAPRRITLKRKSQSELKLFQRRLYLRVSLLNMLDAIRINASYAKKKN